MANIYKDEVRLARYDVCRKRAKRCELMFGISMWVMIFLAIAEIIPHLLYGFLNGLFLGEMMPFCVMLVVTADVVFSICAIFRRDWRFLLGALICAVVFVGSRLFVLFGYLSPIVLLLSLIASIDWRKLEQEEGFPRFEITYAEQTEQQKTQERRAQYRAVQAGTRVEQAHLNVHADMSDLLDEDADQLPAHLENYHDRSLLAEPVVRLQEPHGDRMDHLEEIDEL